jgi:hypothetical protein
MSRNNDESTDTDLIADLLQQTISEFRRLNLNLKTLNQSFAQQIPPIVAPIVAQSSPTSLGDHQLVDTSSPITVGDTVIIRHRFRGQYGVIGTVYKVTRDYYCIRTPLGVEYQKKKRFVALYIGNRQQEST